MKGLFFLIKQEWITPTLVLSFWGWMRSIILYYKGNQNK